MLVGGSVRDHVLGRSIADWDIEVYGIAPSDLEVLLGELGRVDAVGKSFGVWKLGGTSVDIDVSIPRRDSKAGPGHRGILVEGDPFMPIEEAARRRDLTINAMLYDLHTHEIVDPYGGREDLAARRLRAVDEVTFLEDPLRALRVVQLAARFDFRADPALEALCEQAELHELPAERVREEWRKALLKGVRPSAGLRFARRARILERVFPEAANGDDASVDDAVDRLAPVLASALQGSGRRFAAMLGAWLHRVDRAGVEATLDRLLLHRWRGYPLRDALLATVDARDVEPASDTDLRRLATRAELRLALMIRWAVSGSPQLLRQIERAETLGVADGPLAPLLQGRDLLALGVAPGPELGEVLAATYEAQLDGRVTDREDALALARRVIGG